MNGYAVFMVIKSNTLGFLGAAIVGAVIGSLAFMLGMNSATDDNSQPLPPPSANQATDLSELTTAIDSLRISNQLLRSRLLELENRPRAEVRTPANGFASMDDVASLERKLTESLSNTQGTQSVDFKEQVAESLTTIRHEEAVSKVRKGHQRSIENLEERVGKVSDWLELDSYQAGELRTSLIARDQGYSEVINLWESGADDEVIGLAKQTTSQAFWTQMEGVLSPEQYLTYFNRAGDGK